MRVIAIGDIGVSDGLMHIGDEAMFEALIDELRARGATSLTALSAAPEESAERYDLDAISRIGFPPSRESAAARFAEIVAAIAGEQTLDSEDPFWRVRDAVADADAVVIAGGGNMASTWPLHIFERAALGRIAAHHDTPLIVTGQTLGPELSAEDRGILTDLLTSARLVGLRESASGELASALGVSASQSETTLDDASFLGWRESDASLDSTDFTLVSLSTHLGGRSRVEVVRGLAHALDLHAAETGFSTVFHAHWGSLRPAEVRGDAILHEEVRAAMRTESSVAPTGDPRGAAALARGATMLVTSRYHPAVFAAPAGVPVLALSADAYTGVKLNGALAPWTRAGVDDLDVAASGRGIEALRQTAARADSVRARAREALPAARARSGAWWDRVVEAIHAG